MSPPHPITADMKGNNENHPNAARETEQPSKAPPKKKAPEKKKKAQGATGGAGAVNSIQAGFPYYPPHPHAFMNPYAPPAMGMPSHHPHATGGPPNSAAVAAAAQLHYAPGPPHAYGYPPYHMPPHPYYTAYPHAPPNAYGNITQDVNQGPKNPSGGTKQPKALNKKGKTKRNSANSATEGTPSAHPVSQSGHNPQNSQLSAFMPNSMPTQAHQHFMVNPAMPMKPGQAGMHMSQGPTSGNGHSSMPKQGYQEDHAQKASAQTPPKEKDTSRVLAKESQDSISGHTQIPMHETLTASSRPMVALSPGHHVTASTTSTSPGHWTKREDDMLRSLIEEHGNTDWKIVSSFLPGRTESACQSRWQKVLKRGLVRGPWTKEEDRKLVRMVQNFGPRKWAAISEELVGRSGKQCRERWHNHLDPNVNRQSWSEHEDRQILECHMRMGNRWAEMSKYLPGRYVKRHFSILVGVTLSHAVFLLT